MIHVLLLVGKKYFVRANEFSCEKCYIDFVATNIHILCLIFLILFYFTFANKVMCTC